MLNHHLSQKIKLVGNHWFNHLIKSNATNHICINSQVSHNDDMTISINHMIFLKQWSIEGLVGIDT
jgi:hypothetical protein